MEIIIEWIEYFFTTRWHYTMYVVPLVIILIRFYSKNKQALFNNFDSFISWIKVSFEKDGKADGNLLTAFFITVFVYAPARWHFALNIIDPLHLLYGMILDLAYALILKQFLKISDIITLKNGSKKED
jgi:hypothetical protein